jgi:hypothetical protein
MLRVSERRALPITPKKYKKKKKKPSTPQLHNWLNNGHERMILCGELLPYMYASFSFSFSLLR